MVSWQECSWPEPVGSLSRAFREIGGTNERTKNGERTETQEALLFRAQRNEAIGQISRREMDRPVGSRK